MEITKKSKLTEHHVKVMKDISNLVGSAVLSAFPHMPKDLFSYARYEFHFRGSSRTISVHFNYFRRCSSISIRLPQSLKGESLITADNQVSYMKLDSATLVRDVTRLSNGFWSSTLNSSATLVRDVTRLSNGFWSSTLNSSAPFVGLRFDADATYLVTYYQKESETVQGEKEYFNFEEVLE